MLSWPRIIRGFTGVTRRVVVADERRRLRTFTPLRLLLFLRYTEVVLALVLLRVFFLACISCAQTATRASTSMLSMVLSMFFLTFLKLLCPVVPGIGSHGYFCSHV